MSHINRGSRRTSRNIRQEAISRLSGPSSVQLLPQAMKPYRYKLPCLSVSQLFFLRWSPVSLISNKQCINSYRGILNLTPHPGRCLTDCGYKVDGTLAAINSSAYLEPGHPVLSRFQMHAWPVTRARPDYTPLCLSRNRTNGARSGGGRIGQNHMVACCSTSDGMWRGCGWRQLCVHRV
ncbi:hypothetical protein FIBSPDRAFT_600487 [Athelia psychrophila]|uniref:Uncharacterized protein n=1 Tax=Athelia psychrophila TaxID=1759441 RepID=A0A166GSS1_9AGAM|nr:hypothetical protein FIBSPDRAFT_600487 [Fibularhizoctonia sp. CBS 109695]